MSMNGEAAATELPPVPQMQNPVVRLLEDMLEKAKAGQIAAIATVAVTSQRGIMNVYAGVLHGDLYVGTGMLQMRLLSEIMNPPNPSKILRPAVRG